MVRVKSLLVNLFQATLNHNGDYQDDRWYVEEVLQSATRIHFMNALYPKVTIPESVYEMRFEAQMITTR